MGRCRNAGWLGCAALLVCLPPALHARNGRVFTVPFPSAGPASRVEVSVGGWTASAAPGDVISTTSGEWEVVVEFDAAHCAVFCAYRRVVDAYGRTPLVDLLAPPVTTIQLLRDFGSRAVIATVDPAGCGLPHAASRVRVSYEQPCTGGRRLAITGLVGHGGISALGRFKVNTGSLLDGNSFSSASAPLRI